MKTGFDYSRRVPIYVSLFTLKLLILINTPLAYAASAQTQTPVSTVYDAYMIPPGSKLGQRIYLALWDTDRGVKEGLAVFVRNDQRCVGRLALRSSQAKKGPEYNFKLLEGNNCEELQGGNFRFDGRSSRVTKMTWYPSGFKPANIQELMKLKQSNSVAFAPAKTTPEFLQGFIADYKTNRQLAEMKSPEKLASYSRELASLRTSLDMPVMDNFVDAELIGVWEGMFINKEKIYPAQIALWSANISRFQRLVGVVSFAGNQCTVGAEVSRDKEAVNLGLSQVYISMPESKCELLQGNSWINLHKTGDMLNVYLDAEDSNNNRAKASNCLQELPREGCYTAGVFKRAKATKKLQDTLKTARWKYSSPPDADTWASIKDNRPVPERIKQAHTSQVAKNQDVVMQIKREDEQDRQKRIAQYRSEIAAEKQQKINASNRERRLAENRSGNYTGSAQIKPEVVTGPFDGLPGSSFFNALYHGDLGSLDRQTRAYQELKVKQRSDFLGNQPHWSDNVQNAAFRSIRLIDTVYGIYLFNYQSDYSSCLRKDAVTFEVTKTTPDVVVTNGLGWEVARYYGSTDKTHYRINPEFIDIFRRIGRTNPDSISMGLADLLMGGGGINIPEEITSRAPTMAKLGNILKGKGERDLRNQLLDGTRQLIRKFDCNSPEIQQLEKNMIRANQ